MGFRLASVRKTVTAREDWALLVIAASDGLLPIQLQKALFVFGQLFPELGKSGFYEFRPVGGGDFSEQIYSDANALSNKGLVSIRFSEEDGSRRYRLTPAGAARAKEVEKQVPPALHQSLRSQVSWVKTRSIDQLLGGSTAATGPVKSAWGSPDSVRPR
ncbi:MAG: hypothetical protein ABI610_04720 [Acidobacteriota bacterium]